MRLTIMIATSLWLTGCVEVISDLDVGLVDYDQTFLNNAADQADQLEASGDFEETLELLNDYGQLRAIVRSVN